VCIVLVLQPNWCQLVLLSMSSHYKTICLSFSREPAVKTHLKNVYSTVAMALLAAALGGYVHVYTSILSGGLMSTLGTLGFGIALFASRDDEKNRNTRMGYLMGFAGCSGMLATILSTQLSKLFPSKICVVLMSYGCSRILGLSMGPMLDMALMVNPALIPTALLSSCLIFVCFSLSTIFSEHRKYLYIGGKHTNALNPEFRLKFCLITRLSDVDVIRLDGDVVG